MTVGGLVTYTLVITNGAPVAASSLVITDAVPIGASFVAASDGGTLVAGVVSWTVPSLGPGGLAESYLHRYCNRDHNQLHLWRLV